MAECIFCGARADSKEHFWGKWLQKIHDIEPNIPGRRKHRHDIRDGEGNLRIVKGWGEVTGSPVNTTMSKTVCTPCNTGWMSEIQDRTAPVYRRLHENENNLSPDDQTAINNWLGLKVLLHQGRAARDGDALSPEHARIRPILVEERRLNRVRFMRYRKLPEDWRVFVARQPRESDQQVPGVPDYSGFVIGGNGRLGNGLAGDNAVVRDVFIMALYVFDLQAVVTNLHLMLPGCYRSLIDDSYGRIVQLNGAPTLFPRQSMNARDFQRLALQLQRNIGLNPRETVVDRDEGLRLSAQPSTGVTEVHFDESEIWG